MMSVCNVERRDAGSKPASLHLVTLLELGRLAATLLLASLLASLLLASLLLASTAFRLEGVAVAQSELPRIEADQVPGTTGITQQRRSARKQMQLTPGSQRSHEPCDPVYMK